MTIARLPSSLQAQEWPDISTVAADLIVPAMKEELPGAGKRVRHQLAQYSTRVYHSLYLPTNWSSEKTYPVIVEYSGNGGYSNAFGDVSIGRPEGSCFGYGLSGGKDWIWIVLPFLKGSGEDVAEKWWGDPPQFDSATTRMYCLSAIEDTCKHWGGDRQKLLLCGFSRGAIACNFVGLYDDSIARLWKAFIPFSHYDGVRRWPFPGSDRESALQRLKRLDGRPQWICGEKDQVEETKAYLDATGIRGDFTFRSTGFRNHNDAWILRPSPARDDLRDWIKKQFQ